MAISLLDYPTLSTYAVLANQPITAANPTTINGGNYGSDAADTTDVNLSAVSPYILDNANTNAALTQTTALVNAISLIAPDYTTIALSGTVVLTAGKYSIASNIPFVSGTVIDLDAQGDPNAQFFIQAGSAISFASVSDINLVDGALSKNVFWVAGTAITFTGTSPPSIPGIFIGGSQIVINNGNTIDGVLIAQTADVAFTGTGASVVSPFDGGGGEPVVCYAKGTLILTKQGYVPIEHIKPGHQVVTKGKIYDNAYIKNVKETLEPVLWISKFKLDHLNSKTRPICIQQNAFGTLPFADLYVSPGHRLLVNGHMVAAKRLLNGTTVYQLECEEVVYYHLECDDHRAIVANGLLAESYLEENNRHVFDHSAKHRKQHLNKLTFSS